MAKNCKNNMFCENRKAYHDYSVIETIEVGIELLGLEVKSIRNSHINISGAYVQILKDELWLVGANIINSCTTWSQTYKSNRNRKLLCHRKELLDIKQKTEAKGLTAIPLKIYEKNRKIKLLIGIAKGKNLIDKRLALKEQAIAKSIHNRFAFK